MRKATYQKNAGKQVLEMQIKNVRENKALKRCKTLALKMYSVRKTAYQRKGSLGCRK